MYKIIPKKLAFFLQNIQSLIAHTLTHTSTTAFLVLDKRDILHIVMRIKMCKNPDRGFTEMIWKFHGGDPYPPGCKTYVLMSYLSLGEVCQELYKTPLGPSNAANIYLRRSIFVIDELHCN